MKIKFTIFIIIAVTLVSCAWFEESSYEQITGDYWVVWNDLEQNRAIWKQIRNCSSCFEDVVSNYVYAVGHNDSFIIAKRHFDLNTKETYYYVIDIKKNQTLNGTEGVYEFFDKHSFDSFRTALNISNIPFDLNFTENP